MRMDNQSPLFEKMKADARDRRGAPKFSPMTLCMKGGRDIINIFKEKKIKANISKFKKIFKNIEPDKAEFAKKLYEKAAFMDATLEELQDDINESGATITQTNGNGFKVTMENPSQKTYNTMIKNYNATMKLLLELIPEGSEDDELVAFLKGKK